MNDNFYVLDIIHPSDYKLFAGGQVLAGDEKRCPICKSWLFVEEEGNIEIALNYLGKRGFCEYLWNSSLLPIFCEDLINHWLVAGLTGFTTKPVQIVGWNMMSKRTKPVNSPNYKCLIPTSNVKLIEPLPITERCSQCGFIEYNFPKVGSYLPKGIQINQDNLGGTDFFGLIGYNLIFCSEKVLKVTLPKLYKQIAFVKIENWCKWESYNPRKWTLKEYKNYRDKFIIRRPELPDSFEFPRHY
jgi:hypothetical protein